MAKPIKEMTAEERRQHYNAVARKHQAKRRAENPQKLRDDLRRWQERNWFRKLWHCARSHTTQRGGELAFTITEDHLKELYAKQAGLCFWTHIPMVQRTHSPWTVSLDRMKPELGYTIGNVVLCSWFANRARNTMPAPEFLCVLQTVIDYGRRLR